MHGNQWYVVASRVATMKKFLLRTSLNACRSARKQQDSSVNLLTSKSWAWNVVSVQRMLLLLVPTTEYHAKFNRLTSFTGTADGFYYMYISESHCAGSLTIRRHMFEADGCPLSVYQEYCLSVGSKYYEPYLGDPIDWLCSYRHSVHQGPYAEMK